MPAARSPQQSRSMTSRSKRTARSDSSRRSSFFRYLTLGYTFLIAYASLYPFADWKQVEGPLFNFVWAPWPHYYTLSDLALNVLAYMPFGFALALAVLSFAPPTRAAILATLAGTLLSLSMESIQQFISTRVSSNLDLLTNGLGALTGSLVAITLGERWLLSGRAYRWRDRTFLPGSTIDAGFVVLALWLFTQLNPDVWLFGNGELRGVVPASMQFEFRPDAYRWLETGITCVNLAGLALLVRAMARRERSLMGPLFSLVMAALALKGAGAMTLFRPGAGVPWLTPGSMLGIPLGIGVYLSLSSRSRSLVILASGLLLAAGLVLVNLAPENPYLATWTLSELQWTDSVRGRRLAIVCLALPVAALARCDQAIAMRVFPGQ